MNYFEKHVGDWIKDTVSLDMTEDGAYNRLVDQCYQSEKPLPPDIKEVYRLARANKPAERKAVDYVLAKFFDKASDGYTQKRRAGRNRTLFGQAGEGPRIWPISFFVGQRVVLGDKEWRVRKVLP